MRYFIIFFITIVGSRQGLSQGTDYFKEYYPGIYSAEKNILEGHYQNALLEYEKTFKKVGFVFGRDYYNAAVCAAKSGNTQRAFELIRQLVLQGAKLEWLARQEWVKPLKKEKKWRELERDYPKCREEFAKKFNLKVKDQLLAFDVKDQFFRRKLNAYNVYRDTINKIDQVNAKEIKKLIETIGFPGESIIGINDSVSAMHPGDAVLIHQASSVLPYAPIIDFDNLINQARVGKISPHKVANFLDCQAGPFSDRMAIALYGVVMIDSTVMNSPKYLEQIEKQVSKYYYYETKGEQLREVNNKRFLMGLDPKDDYRSKVYYGITQKDFSFQYLGGTSILSFIDEGLMKISVAEMKEFK